MRAGANIRHMMIRSLLALAFAAGILVSPAFAAETAKRSSPVATGETAPDFTLVDQNGRKHTLSAALARGPVVLVFYRGYW
jgi:cytochrome oxidase Cu insertion factor (SCO1/SenC/PrrC family)